MMEHTTLWAIGIWVVMALTFYFGSWALIKKNSQKESRADLAITMVVVLVVCMVAEIILAVWQMFN